MAGKKGRSGRKSKAFIERCITLLGDETLWAEARAKNPQRVLEMAAEYSQGKPAQKVDQTTTLVLKAVRE